MLSFNTHDHDMSHSIKTCQSKLFGKNQGKITFTDPILSKSQVNISIPYINTNQVIYNRKKCNLRHALLKFN